jgi:hypothetical protein
MLTRELTIEGITFKIAPTPIAKMANAQGIIAGAGTGTEEGMRALIEAIFWGARRARGECEKSGAITLDWLQENIDSHNAKDIFDVFRELNSLQTPKGEAPAGEAQPESPNP